MDQRPTRSTSQLWRDSDVGWAAASELISAVFVCMGGGWLADRWLGTGPWLMVAGATVGFILGMYLAYLRAEAQAKVEDAKRPRL